MQDLHNDSICTAPTSGHIQNAALGRDLAEEHSFSKGGNTLSGRYFLGSKTVTNTGGRTQR